MKKRLWALALAAALVMAVLPPGAAAAEEDAPPGKVVFESGVPDENGVFEVNMTISDMTFRVIQFALRYDPTVVQAIRKDGETTDRFSHIATLKQDWISTAGTWLFPDKGLIDFTIYINVGETNACINEEGEAVIGSEPLEVFTFRFKRLKDGDTGIQIATEEKGEPISPSCPEGVIALGSKGNVPIEIAFRDAGQPDSGTTETPIPSGGGSGSSSRPSKTVNRLLDGAVILQIGSHAAVVKAGAVALYPGENMVTAYAHDNRTFVPLRFVGERLGAEVDWDNDSRTAIVKKDGHEIRMPIGSATFTLDGEEKALDAPAELTPSTEGYSRTMVPIRFVSEALGYQVEWDQARNLVIIAPTALQWDPKGSVEGQAMDKAVSTLLMFGNFV